MIFLLTSHVGTAQGAYAEYDSHVIAKRAAFKFFNVHHDSTVSDLTIHATIF